MKLPLFTLLAGVSIGLPLSHAAPPRLLPFQGRLTDANGAPVADGAKVVQFKIYDAPTGGNAVWGGEVQKLSVNGGLVSTLLGSKADLSAVDFNQALYLEITVDANSDQQITQTDPPLLPRQSILPAVFAVEAAIARDSGKLAGADWSAIMVSAQGAPTNNPFGSYVQGSRLFPGSVGPAQLGGSIAGSGLTAESGVLAVNTDTASLEVAGGKVQVKVGGIDETKLSAAVRETLVPAGTILPFGSATAPSGYLICDGSAVSRAQYAKLFAAIGTTWGSGNGSTTFNVPDVRGRFLRGVDGTANRDPEKDERAPSATGGASGNAVGSVQNDENKPHSHAITSSAGSAASFPNGVAMDYMADTRNTATVAGGGSRSTRPTDLFANTAIAQSTGTESRPKNAYVNYIIKY